MYNYIINPKTNRKVKITSILGKKIIKNYINFLNGGGKHKKISFKKQNVCGSGVKAKSLGSKISLPWFIASNGTTWDWEYPQTQRQICKHLRHSWVGSKKEVKKIYKDCKKMCPKKTYLGYSPKIENSKGKVTKERGWCCYKSPLHKNVKNIKKNFLKEKREVFDAKSLTWGESKLNKTSENIRYHLKKYFKELNKLKKIPHKFKDITHQDVITFRNNVLSDLYDSGNTGKTQKTFRNFILEELNKISKERLSPRVIQHHRDEDMDMGIFGELGDDTW